MIALLAGRLRPAICPPIEIATGWACPAPTMDSAANAIPAGRKISIVIDIIRRRRRGSRNFRKGRACPAPTTRPARAGRAQPLQPVQRPLQFRAIPICPAQDCRQVAQADL